MSQAEIPLLAEKHYHSPTIFMPEHLLRETRRQKQLAEGAIPEICVLDPDGDIVRHLLARNLARRNPFWACYHTDLYDAQWESDSFGIIGCAVGGPFAVLLAEQLFASGCQLLVSFTSAGQILPLRPPPYYVLIERALRDEGTSHHYLPPSRFSALNQGLSDMLTTVLAEARCPVERGATWTTDAPYRETAVVVAARREEGILAVEMEAASLYAFAQARNRPVVCFAHVTNQMGQQENDFEKGEAEGSPATLGLISQIARAWRKHGREVWGTGGLP